LRYIGLNPCSSPLTHCSQLDICPTTTGAATLAINVNKAATKNFRPYRMLNGTEDKPPQNVTYTPEKGPSLI